MSVDAEVFVIGAGPAGLTAAYCLTKEARSVIIIERDPIYVGGISRTVQYKDFLFDIGGHRFFSKSKEIVALWQEILPDDFIARPRLSRIYYNGKFFSYPLKAFEALLKLGVFTSTACMASYAYAKAFPVAPARTFHEWVRNQFGERLFQIFFKTYTEKVWGMSCDEISADWAAQRIKGLDLLTAVINGLKRSLHIGRKPKADGDTVKSLIESFQYPRKGPGMMWDAAARKIRANGGRLLMGRELVSLEFDAAANLWRIEVETTKGERESFTARHVVSSAPVRELVPRIKPVPISLLHARALRYRDFLTVALMVRKEELFDDNWIYIHDPSVKVGRVQNYRSWSPEMVPAGMSCLGLEYFCFEGDNLWDASDSDLIALAKKEVAQIGLDRRRRRGRRPRGAPAQGLSGLRRRLSRQHRRHPARPRGQLPDAAHGRPQRHAQIQQPGPRDDDGDAHRAQHPRRTTALRRVERQRGRPISRGGRVRRAERARQRAAGSGEGRRRARGLAAYPLRAMCERLAMRGLITAGLYWWLGTWRRGRSIPAQE